MAPTILTSVSHELTADELTACDALLAELLAEGLDALVEQPETELVPA